MKLPRSVQLALTLMEAAGYEAYPVGGCVRDFLLGKTAPDFDITTSALPEETKQVFAEYPVIETGIKHGTVTVLIDQTPLEITTFRLDVGYSDGRHPDEVVFTRTLEEDLARRDFTVNAMAYHRKRGVIDPFGGREDLARKQIRCVGDAKTRFCEDALRILRGLRFAATLGFSVEENTAAAMRETKETLSRISGERITAELCKLCCGSHAAEIAEAFSDVLPGVSPNLEKLRTLPPILELRLAALLGNTDAMTGLKLSNAQKKSVLCLLTAQVTPPKTRYEALCLLRDHGENARLLAAFHGFALSEDGVWRIDQLAIGGSELMERGITGRKIGETLSTLLDRVMRGELPNEKEVLLSSIDF